MLRQAADFAERDDIDEERDDERPRFARHQQQNSETQNQGNHQINQSCQCQFHGGYYEVFSAVRKGQI